MSPRLRCAASGAAAAALWALQEPLDQGLLRYDYSDVAVLGKGITRGPRWRAVGWTLHLANGALFGLVYHEARQRVKVGERALAVGMALGEHVALYPLCFFVDRYHPGRGEPGVPPLLTSPRAFAQATWRHVLFGLALASLTARRSPMPDRLGRRTRRR